MKEKDLQRSTIIEQTKQKIKLIKFSMVIMVKFYRVLQIISWFQ
jgi:hypothetical protein